MKEGKGRRMKMKIKDKDEGTRKRRGIEEGKKVRGMKGE